MRLLILGKLSRRKHLEMHEWHSLDNPSEQDRSNYPIRRNQVELHQASIPKIGIDIAKQKSPTKYAHSYYYVSVAGANN